MIDVGTPLVFAYILSIYGVSQLVNDRSRPALIWPVRAISAVMFCFCLFSIVTDFRLRVPAPHWVDWVIAAVLGAAMIFNLFFYIRADARRLRAKQAAKQ